jgi:hypothetical protein
VVRHLGLYSLAASRHEVAATKGDKALTPKGTRNPNLRGEPAQKRRTAADEAMSTLLLAIGIMAALCVIVYALR